MSTHTSLTDLVPQSKEVERALRLDATYVMQTYGRAPIELVEGKGMLVKDSEGNDYLDFLSGIGVDSLGHCHPAVVQAIADQAQKLIHVSNYYYVEHRGEVAQMISELLNCKVTHDKAKPWKTFFANSGAEANECAIKLARLAARKKWEAAGNAIEEAPHTVATLKGSFHGRTLAALAATAQPSKQASFTPLPAGFIQTPLNDISALRELFQAQGLTLCALMVECIQGESGVHPCTQGFLSEARGLCDKYGVLLICDEVQCGIFRTGLPFGFQHFDIMPDIVTIAKGVASGFPTGMCAAREEVAKAFSPGDHGSTFGGSCLAMAAAKATLSTLMTHPFPQNVEAVGTYLRERLQTLPGVIEVRGLGLMIAAELQDSAPSAPSVVERALKEGLLINATGPHTLRFLPPLICTEEDVDQLIERLSLIL